MNDAITLSHDHADQDLNAIHAYLSRSYWSPGVAMETVARSIANSIVVGAFDDGAQVGFARIISDKATFAYLADVYVLESHRRRGIAAAMIRSLHALPELQGLRRWVLFTADMHPLYASLGWTAYETPERLMVRELYKIVLP